MTDPGPNSRRISSVACVRLHVLQIILISFVIISITMRHLTAMTRAAALAALLGGAAGMGSCAANVDASDGFNLRMLNASTGAQCLDGSPAGFYLRSGVVTSWVIEMEGGG
jgi:hypothetical protein